MYEIDNIDGRIVELLMENSRMPAAVIARRVGRNTSERVVRYRIDKMVKEGVIRIWPVVNTQAFGLTTRTDVVLEFDSVQSEIYHFVTEVIGKLQGVRKTTKSIVPVVIKDVYKWQILHSVIVSGKNHLTE